VCLPDVANDVPVMRRKSTEEMCGEFVEVDDGDRSGKSKKAKLAEPLGRSYNARVPLGLSVYARHPGQYRLALYHIQYTIYNIQQYGLDKRGYSVQYAVQVPQAGSVTCPEHSQLFATECSAHHHDYFQRSPYPSISKSVRHRRDQLTNSHSTSADHGSCQVPRPSNRASCPPQARQDSAIASARMN
jgi:hypothetical protein